MAEAPRLTLIDVAHFERDVVLRLPFRFGMITLREAPQAFLRVRIRLEDGREGHGMAAELLAPKWFDKNPALSNEDNFQQLRDAIASATDLYRAAGPATAFGHYVACYKDQMAQGMRPLVEGYGLALHDKAILDALCRVHGVSVFDAMAGNLAGITQTELAPDLAGFDIDAFVSGLRPVKTVKARHTVGLIDPLKGSGHLGDGLPETLTEVIETYGQRIFKLNSPLTKSALDACRCV